MIHDFRTDERPEDAAHQHDRDLGAFCTTVFDRELPKSGQEPWCVHVGSIKDTPAIELYVARAVTDLRAETLKPSA